MRLLINPQTAQLRKGSLDLPQTERNRTRYNCDSKISKDFRIVNTLNTFWKDWTILSFFLSFFLSFLYNVLLSFRQSHYTLFFFLWKSPLVFVFILSYISFCTGSFIPYLSLKIFSYSKFYLQGIFAQSPLMFSLDGT